MPKTLSWDRTFFRSFLSDLSNHIFKQAFLPSIPEKSLQKLPNPWSFGPLKSVCSSILRVCVSVKHDLIPNLYLTSYLEPCLNSYNLLYLVAVPKVGEKGYFQRYSLSQKFLFPLFLSQTWIQASKHIHFLLLQICSLSV